MKTPSPGLSRDPMSSIRGSGSRKPHCRDFLEVRSHQFRMVAVENLIARTFSTSNLIDSRQRQSKTLLAGLSRGPMSSMQGGGSRKPLRQDFLKVQCHQFGAVAVENPIAWTFSRSDVINSGWWQSKTSMPGLSRGPLSSI